MMKKKHFPIVMLVLSSLVCFSCSGKTAESAGTAARSDRLNTLISEYSHKDGFEVTTVNRLGFSIVKSLVNMISTYGNAPEAKKFLNTLDGIRKVSIVEYESCSQYDRDQFNLRVRRILNDENLIMEARDDGDVVQIYGVDDSQAGNSGNYVLYIPSESTLINLTGSLPPDTVISIVNQ